MDPLSGLNPQQARAATTTGPCLIVASPGSGKTKTLVSKAAWLLQTYPGCRVLAVSFTNKSAGELKERLVRQVGDANARRCNFGTFHSICKQQIEKGLGLRLNILTGGAQDNLIIRAINTTECDISLEDARQIIELAKSTPNGVQLKPDASMLFETYQDLLRRNNQVDMMDLVLIAAREMRAGKLRPFPHEYLLVDEFQDTDAIQYEWIHLHAVGGARITVVGDDDQSIYGWRSAMGYDGMARFQADQVADHIVLDTNYRSRSEILTPAAKLIGRNEIRMPKQLISAKGVGGRVRCYRYPGEDEEALAIANEVSKCPSDWAILARNNWILDTIEATLSSFRVPYFRVSGGGFWKLHEVVLFLTLIKSLLQTNRQKAGLDQVLHWIGIQDAELAAIHAIHGASVSDLDIGKYKSLLSKESYAKMSTFASLYRSWEKNAPSKESLTIIGMAQWMIGFAEEDKCRRRIMRAATVLGKLQGSLAQRVAMVTIHQADEKHEGVALITMHSSKGLEFPKVWIARAEDSVVPSDKSPLSEERRLFYVAMTRAMDELVISATLSNPASPFLPEAGLVPVDAFNSQESSASLTC